MNVLIADDEQSIVATLEEDLKEAGHRVFACRDGNRALEILKREEVDYLVCDLNMPGLNGLLLLEQAKKLLPNLGVIIMTGYATIESAVQAMKLGATDYLVKPFLNDQIVKIIAKLARITELERENARLREQVESVTSPEGFVGASKVMQDVFSVVKTVARSESNVLITGETGTGKEVTARTLHNLSLRRTKPFVSLSCAAVPSTLLEDELFGHERGAYTDARDKKLGRLERAHGGTFFLDDIDDIPLDTQVKLLRVLQEREFERLGGEKTIKVDLRVVAATKVDLRKAVAEGKFRSDLYFRLNVVPIALPPLRLREGDVPLLSRHFIKRYGGSRNFTIDDQTLRAMETYEWPGNVRELEHAIERAIALAGDSDVLRREHIVPPQAAARESTEERFLPVTLKECVDAAEKRHIVKMLEHTRGHKAHAASLLGISRKSLWEKLKTYRLSQEKDEE